MHPDPKKIALAIIAKGKPADDGGEMDSKEAAAQDVLDAVKGGSAKDLAEALESFWQLVDGPQDAAMNS